MKLKTFFKTTTLAIDEGVESQTRDIAEWKRSGSLLVTLEEGGKSESSEAKSNKKIELVAGEFVEFSADRKSVLSAKPGYPCVFRKEGETSDRVTVDLEPILAISNDGWTVKMKIYPAFEGCTLPNEMDIMAMLEEEGITWGIREKKISAVLQKIENGTESVADEIIAKGRLPVNGGDAKLRMNFLSSAIAGKKDSSGSIDYRERNLFIGVDEGQLLATKVAVTEGLCGINVFGHEVPQIKGKDLNFNPGPEVIFNERTGEITAAISGVVSAVNDTSVKISDKLNISGDVDYNTGNLDCRGCVEVSGSIRPDFQVIAGGDMVIGGNIESAQVTGHANVVVRGGMTGKESFIRAGGSVDILFAESGTIRCGGNLVIRKEVYFCDISSAQDIEFEDAVVLGSKLFSGGSITVANVDTDSSSLSFLAAAVDYGRYERYLERQDEVSELKEKFNRLQHRFGPGSMNEDLEDLEEELEEAVEAMEEFNLVPVAPEDNVAGGLRYACKQKIRIKGEIQSGVSVRIGNVETRTKQVFRNGYFVLIGELGEIVFNNETRSGKTE